MTSGFLKTCRHPHIVHEQAGGTSSDSTVDMQVLTVPGLEPLMASHLTPLVGFPFSWAPEPAAAAKLQKATCVSPSGHVSLVTWPGVLVRVSLAGQRCGCHVRVMPGVCWRSLFSWQQPSHGLVTH